MWIELEGAVNVRDIGGLPAAHGRETVTCRVIRSDNLQDLTDRDVRLLIDELGVRAVADLRTPDEVRQEGPGPLTALPEVRIENHSLFVHEGHETDAAAAEDAEPVLLPWQIRGTVHDYTHRGAVGVYLRYLVERPDSVVATLRLIAHADGAVIVHCAAGKDRTGIVIAVALLAAGVEPAAVVEDYALTAERIDAIFDRLLASPMYNRDVADGYRDKHTPRAETMTEVLTAIDSDFGGIHAWLRANGWTEDDQHALEKTLLSAD